MFITFNIWFFPMVNHEHKQNKPRAICFGATTGAEVLEFC